MGKIADDLDGIKQSTEDAVKKARTISTGRTPNAAENNNGQYPLRNVMEYIGGHRQVFDSTPGHRVIEHAHGSGTFQQWAEDGTEIRVVVGNKHEHLKSGYTLTVNQNGDIKIDGHCRVSVGGGAHVEVAGDVSIVSTGTITQYAAKDINLVAGGKVNILGNKSLNLTTDGTHTVRVGKDHKSTVNGKSDNIIDGNHTSSIKGNSDNAIKGNMTSKTSGNETSTISGTKEITSSGNMTFKAPKIDLNP